MKRAYVLVAILLALPLAGWGQTIEAINAPTIKDLNQVAPFHEGLAAVRKGSQWGFINSDGKLVVDFRGDLVWNEHPDPQANGVGAIAYPRFRDGRCPIKVMGEDGIPLYGFIDTGGKTVIAPEFLNVTEFEGGLALGIYYKKTFRGKSNFQLNIYEHSFTEVVLNPAGEMIWPLAERQNIIMQARQYKTPAIQARILEDRLVAVESAPEKWEIRKIEL